MMEAGCYHDPTDPGRTFLSNEDDIKKLNRILDLLDEDDDVQAVYHNWDE